MELIIAKIKEELKNLTLSFLLDFTASNNSKIEISNGALKIDGNINNCANTFNMFAEALKRPAFEKEYEVIQNRMLNVDEDPAIFFKCSNVIKPYTLKIEVFPGADVKNFLHTKKAGNKILLSKQSQYDDIIAAAWSEDKKDYFVIGKVKKETIVLPVEDFLKFHNYSVYLVSEIERPNYDIESNLKIHNDTIKRSGTFKVTLTGELRDYRPEVVKVYCD